MSPEPTSAEIPRLLATMLPLSGGEVYTSYYAFFAAKIRMLGGENYAVAVLISG